MKIEQIRSHFQTTTEAGGQSGLARNIALAGKSEEWTEKLMRKWLPEN